MGNTEKIEAIDKLKEQEKNALEGVDQKIKDKIDE